MAFTRVKICGITNAEDALEAVKAGAHFLGFNFYRKSPRYVEPAKVKEILEYLHEHEADEVLSAGVFVDESAETIHAAMDASGLRIVQLHGNETPELLEELRDYYRIKAVKVSGAKWAQALDQYDAEAFLADAPHLTLPGGTGEGYDYSLVTSAAQTHKIFLAGGLTPETVADAVRAVRPYCVDVASGVELSPGKKDPTKVHAFCRAVQEADQT